MTEMVERVAKAIYEGRNGRGAVPFRHQLQSHQEPYVADASAAIEAMRDIPPEMINKALGTTWGFGVADWNMLIDAALSRPTPEKE